MTLRLRLARGGTKKRPFYRVVVCDKRAPRDGRFIEKVGYYNPLLPKDASGRISLNQDRIRHWLGHGAIPSDRVHRFLDQENILSRQARHNPQKAKPNKKTLERIAKSKEQEEQNRKERQEAQRKSREEKKAQKEKPAQDKIVTKDLSTKTPSQD